MNDLTGKKKFQLNPANIINVKVWRTDEYLLIFHANNIYIIKRKIDT